MALIGVILQLPAPRVVAPTSVPVTGVTVDPTTVNVVVGQTVKLTATVTPSNATDQSISFTSSDETIATVDNEGTVSGVKAGAVQVTATAGGKSTTASITVTAAE